jgi:hypothetical protein
MNAYLVHVGYALMLSALVARDILWLRAILVLAQSVLAFYGWRTGVAGIAGWNALFVTINIVWVLRILHERRAVALTGPLRALHESRFAALTAAEFLRWWRQGVRETVRDVSLTHANQFPEHLYFLMHGTVRVSRDGEHVTNLPAGFFVAEMSLLTGEPATADVVADGEVDVVRWSVAELRAMREASPQLWVKVQSVLGRDLVEKMARGTVYYPQSAPDARRSDKS